MFRLTKAYELIVFLISSIMMKNTMSDVSMRNVQFTKLKTKMKNVLTL